MTALSKNVLETARSAREGWESVLGTGPYFTHQALGRNIEPTGLEGYWCDLRHKSPTADPTAGADASRRDGAAGRRDWVIPLAQAALGAWERRYDGEPTEERFLALAERLIQQGRRQGDSIVWRVGVPVPKYALEPGWASAMGQGQAISVLLRAHALTAEDRFREAADAALRPLLLPVSHGGLHRELAGALVLEEYPTARPCAVLNGWIFALLGVHELAVAGGNPDARALLDRSADGVLRLLHRYDAEWWSLYSLFDHGWHDLAKPFYQRLHPVLLDALSLARPDVRLDAMAERWRAQLVAPAIARVTANKLAFRVYRSIRRSRNRA